MIRINVEKIDPLFNQQSHCVDKACTSIAGFRLKIQDKKDIKYESGYCRFHADCKRTEMLRYYNQSFSK